MTTRLEQLKQAHPFLFNGEIRLILVSYYHLFRDDHTSESFEASIQEYTDDLCLMSKHQLLNVLATAFEASTISRKELVSMR